MKTRIFLGAVALALSAPAAAQGGQIAVRYGDLNLSSAQGLHALDRRIARAAQQVCGDPWTAELAMARMARNCRAEAIVSARAGAAMARQGFAGTSVASGSK